MKMRVNCRVALTAILLLASARPFDAIGSGKQEGSPKAAKEAKPPHGTGVPEDRLDLAGKWTMQSSFLEKGMGPNLSQPGLSNTNWHRVQVPSTVLNALTKAGLYPDIRIGLNAYRVPDSSDEFNAKHDLAKFSHLPGKRNAWRDPWWFRREFTQLKARLLLATTNFPDRTCVSTFAPRGSRFTFPDNDSPHSDRRFFRELIVE